MTARLLVFRAQVCNRCPDSFLLHCGCVVKDRGKKGSGAGAWQMLLRVSPGHDGIGRFSQ